MEFDRTFRIGTRQSPLAIKQGEEVLGGLRKFYPFIKAEIVGIDTAGDKDKATPISDVEGTDFFTREIDEVLLKGDIDFAIHSAKDLADTVPEGLCIAAITKPLDPYDALVSKGKIKLKQLRYGARIGASSNRRKAQLKAYRDDFEIVNIRGNIQERLNKLDTTDLEAVIIAACALKRLGLEDRIAERIPFEILRPHSLQGSLAVVTRKDDLELVGFLSKIDAKEAILR